MVCRLKPSRFWFPLHTTVSYSIPKFSHLRYTLYTSELQLADYYISLKVLQNEDLYYFGHGSGLSYRDCAGPAPLLYGRGLPGYAEVVSILCVFMLLFS